MDRHASPTPRRGRHRRRSSGARHALTGTAVIATAIAASALVTALPGSALNADPRAGAAPAQQPPPVLPGPLVESLTRPAATPSPVKPPVIRGPAWTKMLPARTTQAIRTVSDDRWCPQIWCARTEVWERVAGRWQIVTRPNGSKAVFRSQVGQNGFASARARRQGDMRTPSGVYDVAVTFSTTKQRPTEMPWRRRLPTSTVSDAPGRTYNTWIEAPGNTYGDRRMMSWGLWIDYNNPRLDPGDQPAPTPGRGSGIFMHTSNTGAPHVPTAGCVQIPKPADMRWIVRWLDPDAHPRIVNNR